MAITTVERRKNVSSIGQVFMISGVTPNANKDSEWRQQVGWGYGGITVAQALIILSVLDNIFVKASVNDNIFVKLSENDIL